MGEGGSEGSEGSDPALLDESCDYFSVGRVCSPVNLTGGRRVTTRSSDSGKCFLLEPKEDYEHGLACV